MWHPPRPIATTLALSLAFVPFITGVVAFDSLARATAPLDDADPTEFTPVAPAAAIQASLAANLKIVRDWLNDRDFASAAESAESLKILAEISRYQSASAEWQARVKSLKEACAELAARAKAKDANGGEMAAGRCDSLLAEFTATPPAGDKLIEKNFRPAASLRSLMKLLDGTYADAKSAKQPADLANFAFTLAEAANVTKHLREDAKWRELADAATFAAIDAARTAEAGDRDAARAKLKIVYSRCDACHQANKRR